MPGAPSAAAPGEELPDFNDFEAARLWFAGQPRGVSMTLAVRAALRALPLIVGARGYNGFTGIVVLPCMRSMAVTWAAARYPANAPALRGTAAVAWNGPAHAYDLLNSWGYGVRGGTNLRRALGALSVIGPATVAAREDGMPEVAFAAADAGASAASALRRLAPAGVDDDARELVRLSGPSEREQWASGLTLYPLWLDAAVHPRIDAVRNSLRDLLLAANEGWEVWTAWYEARRDGQRSFGEAKDMALATLPDDVWQQGPAAANARIKQLIAG